MLSLANYKIFLRGISLALLMVIVILIFSSRQTTAANNTAFWVAHTEEVLFHTEKLYSAAVSIETGERAFLLTRQLQFRDLFVDSKTAAGSEIQTIRRLTADNPVQQKRIDSMSVLIQQRIHYADSIVHSLNDIAVNEAVDIVKHDQGKLYTDNIRVLVGNMQKEENRLLQLRKRELENAISVQHKIFTSSIIGMLVLLLYIFWKEKEHSIKKEKSKSEALFRNLLESAADAVVIINDRKQIVFINQQTEQLFGYNSKQLTGMPIGTLIPGYISPAGGTRIAEQTGIKKDSTEFPIETNTAVITTDDGVLESICTRDISAARLGAEKLKKSEEFFRLLVKGVKDYAIFMIDTRGIVTSWNSGAEQIKGYREDEITGKSFEIFYTKEDIDKGEPFQNLALAAKFGHYETIGRRLRKNRTMFWADVVFTALKDDNNTIYGYCKITRDITEQKRAQEQLEYMSKQIDQSNDAIYIIDADLKLKTWNRGAENLYGFTKAEVLGKDPNLVLQTKLKEGDLNTTLSALSVQDYWTGELKRVTKSGTEIYVRGSSTSVRDENGNITGYVSSSYDITLQTKLMQDVNHLANIVGQTSEAIFSRGTDNRIISWNRGAEKLFEISKEEALGKTVNELGYLRMSREELEKNRKELTEHGFWKTEMYLNRRNGSSFFGAVSANVIRDEKGTITSFNFIVKDITHRKQLEEQLKNSNMEMEAFSYSVSHDLRAPLRAIAGFTAKLEENYSNKLDDEAKRLTSVIKNSTQKMGNLIDDLLAFSRMTRLDIIKTMVDNNSTVREIASSIGQGSNKNIEWLIHPLHNVMADKNTIGQVWTNLISNAVKYSAKVPAPKIEIGSYKEDSNIIFYVKDNGIGFNEKYKSKLFKVFQRLHSADEFEGTGIGLAIVEKVISKHGGSVWVKAGVNEGACFSFSLPHNAVLSVKNNYIL